jgi:hypothetical protein
MDGYSCFCLKPDALDPGRGVVQSFGAVSEYMGGASYGGALDDGELRFSG